MAEFKKTYSATAEGYSSRSGQWNEAKIDLVTGLDSEAVLDVKFQDGPRKEEGLNGVQVRDLLLLCLERVQILNTAKPCRENSLVITKIQEAIMWDDERTYRRTLAGTEGYDK